MGSQPIRSGANILSVRQTDRAFGLTFAVVFSIIGGIIWWVKQDIYWWPFVVAAIFLAFTLLMPGLLLPLNRIWGWVGGKFGAMNNHVILGLFYVLFVVPFGIVMRIAGRDPLGQRSKRGTKTFWTDTNRQLNRETLRDMF